jgi:rod shape-determining protein MreD
MLKPLKIIILIIAALILQVTILPAYLSDPFKPNLLIVAVVYIGFKTGDLGAFPAFALGILQDCFSGIYLGLNGFSYLCIYFILNLTADRLFTDNRYLMVFVVFLATLFNGVLNLLLLLLFPPINSIYATILPDLLPQGLVNALFSTLIFSFPAVNALVESK